MGYEGRGWSVSESPFIHTGHWCRRLVAKASVRADVIVMVSPLFQQNLRFFQGIEGLRIQALITQAAIEAFIVAVLPRAARFDIQGFDPQLRQPALD